MTRKNSLRPISPVTVSVTNGFLREKNRTIRAPNARPCFVQPRVGYVPRKSNKIMRDRKIGDNDAQIADRTKWLDCRRQTSYMGRNIMCGSKSRKMSPDRKANKEVILPWTLNFSLRRYAFCLSARKVPPQRGCCVAITCSRVGITVASSQTSEKTKLQCHVGQSFRRLNPSLRFAVTRPLTYPQSTRPGTAQSTTAAAAQPRHN